MNSCEDGRPILSFAAAESWEKWLAKNHARSGGVWLRIQKKGSGLDSPTYAEALDCALCRGWIDGRKKSAGAGSWLQMFTPRRPRGAWSKRNTEHAERLIRDGRMKPAGLAEIEAAKKDGRWKAAYDPPSAAVIPTDFLEALARNKKALAFFDALNKANRYAISYRLQTAKKAETRQKRVKAILAMMAQGKKFH